MKSWQSHGTGKADPKQGLQRGRDSAIQRQLRRASEVNGKAKSGKARAGSARKLLTVRSDAPTKQAPNIKVTALPRSPSHEQSANSTHSKTKTFKSVQDLIAARKQLLIALYGQRAYSDAMRTEYQATLHDQDKYWQMLSERRTTYKADKELFLRLGAAIRFHVDQTQRHGSFKDHLLKCADAGTERQLFLVKELGLRLDAARLLGVHEVPEAVTAAAKALHAHLPAAAKADKLAAQGSKLVPTLTPRTKGSATPSLNARKETLLAAMEQLTTEKLDPRVRAKRVQSLRQQWQAISHSDHDYLNQLDHNFAAVGEKAYEPSRVYFSALAKKLADNLAKRTELANSLRDFYAESDWDHMEWKSLESMLGVVKQQWQSHAPTERDQTRPVKRLFESSYKSIESKLNQQYDRNAEEGRRLIALMTSLSRQPGSSASLEAMLGIKNQWQSIGVMRIEEKSKLKQQLSEATRVTVANRKQQLQELQVQRAADKQARSLIDNIESATALEGEALLDERDAVSNIGKQFQTLVSTLHANENGLPKENLELMFKERYARYFAKAERMLAERRRRAMEDFHVAARLVGNAEVQFITGAEVQDVSEEASEYIQNVRFLPRHGQALLLNRLNFIQKIKE
ncbi:MAG: hypothetical protein AB8B48_14480 [Pseudomonadales bacterium]